MFNYIIEFTVCLSAFYLLYILLYQKETFFRINRTYLLGTLVLSLLIPLLHLYVPIWFQTNPVYVHTIAPVTIGLHDLEGALAAPQQNSIKALLLQILGVIYLAGVGWFGLRFVRDLIQIYRHYRSGEKSVGEGIIFISTQGQHAPYSFFSCLFLPKEHGYTDGELREIVRHESAHIHQRHSIDILIIEMLCILFWVNPVVFLYDRALRNAHEYFADHLVIAESSLAQYSRLLLTRTQPGLQLSLSNQFYQSQLKSRIHMMTRSESRSWRKVKYFAILPIVCIAFAVFGFQQQPGIVADQVSYTLPDTIPANYKIKGEIFKVVEEMPRFPGCEESAGSSAEKQSCAQKKLGEYIGQRLNYPNEAKKNGVEGIVVAGFVVSKEGYITGITIKRDIGMGCGNEVLRVLNTMNAMEDRWIPGKQRGQIVNVEMVVPVRFALPAEKEATDEQAFMSEFDREDVQFVIDGRLQSGKPSPPLDSDQINTVDVYKTPTADQVKLYGLNPDKGLIVVVTKNTEIRTAQKEVFKVVEEMPRFPGCEEISDERARQKCAQKKLLEYIFQHLKYPADARANNIEGRVIVAFIVDENGKVNEAKILEGLGHGCDEAVLAVFDKMQSDDITWIPGKQRGRAVSVQMTLPVKFKADSQPSSKGKQKKKGVPK